MPLLDPTITQPLPESPVFHRTYYGRVWPVSCAPLAHKLQQPNGVEKCVRNEHWPKPPGSRVPPRKDEPHWNDSENSNATLIEVIRKPDGDADVNSSRRTIPSFRGRDNIATKKRFFEYRI